jgi:predicted nucleic acid-binding protein
LLVSWITDEKREDKSQTAGLEAVRKEVDNGETALVASTLSRTEVFWLPLTDEQKRKYREFFQRENVIELGVSGAIAEKAAEIRKASQRTRKDGQVEMMKTPDAIQLATAIIYDVDEFQTFDGTAKKARPFSLIQLSASSTVDGLKIVVPAAALDPQGTLFVEHPKV